MAREIFKLNLKNILFWVGVAIVVGTHAMIIRDGLPQALVQQHAMFNLGAGTAIIISRFMK